MGARHAIGARRAWEPARLFCEPALVRLKRWAKGVDWAEWLALGLLALTLGELRANNTWDYPTYLLVALGGLAFARVLRPEGTVWRESLAVAVRFVLLVLASTLLFQPYLSRYGAAYTSVGLWQGPRTVPGDYLVIHGLFLFILASYVLSRVFGYQARGALARSLRLSIGRPLRLGRYNRLPIRSAGWPSRPCSCSRLCRCWPAGGWWAWFCRWRCWPSGLFYGATCRLRSALRPCSSAGASCSPWR
jgi:hypothetical protein